MCGLDFNRLQEEYRSYKWAKIQRSAELQSPGLETCFTTLQRPSKTADVCSGDTRFRKKVAGLLISNFWLLVIAVYFVLILILTQKTAMVSSQHSNHV